MVFTLIKQLGMSAVLVGVVWAGYATYQWKHTMDTRLERAEHAALYLFVNTEVPDEQGKPLRRVDLIDRALAKSLK